jgi:hypothetical protein
MGIRSSARPRRGSPKVKQQHTICGIEETELARTEATGRRGWHLRPIRPLSPIDRTRTKPKQLEIASLFLPREGYPSTVISLRHTPMVQGQKRSDPPNRRTRPGVRIGLQVLSTSTFLGERCFPNGPNNRLQRTRCRAPLTRAVCAGHGTELARWETSRQV